MMLKLSGKDLRSLTYFTPKRFRFFRTQQQCCCLKTTTTVTAKPTKSTPEDSISFINNDSTKFQTTGRQKERIENNVLDFENFETAFKPKQTGEILRALLVYKLCSSNIIMDNNRKLIEVSRRILGKTGFEVLMKNTFYGHFVVGETRTEIGKNLSLMKDYGVGAILNYGVEDAEVPENILDESLMITHEEEEDTEYSMADIKARFERGNSPTYHQNQAVKRSQTYFYEGEKQCDDNMDVYLHSIEMTADIADNGFSAIKITALGRPVLLFRLTQILNQTQKYFDRLASSRGSSITERTIAEETFEQGLVNLGVNITPSESKDLFHIIDTSHDGVIDIREWYEFFDPRLRLVDVLRERTSSKELFTKLTTTEINELRNITDRLFLISQRAETRKVRLMVDAEQTWFQPAISFVTLEAMKVFNSSFNSGDFPIVYNTYQCYLKDIKSNIFFDVSFSRHHNFKFAGKFVTGAYMDEERSRAQTKQYPDPIHDTKENTDLCHLEGLTMAFKEVRERGANIMVGSHNEKTVHKATMIMKEFGIQRSDNAIFFGQLLGMCDVITYALGRAGYSAYKYVPYGPVEEVVPYLSRRAMENKSIFKRVDKEREMLWKELVRRARTGKLRHN